MHTFHHYVISAAARWFSSNTSAFSFRKSQGHDVIWNYLSNKFFFRNFFVAAAAVDDDDEPAVEHVSVVNISLFKWWDFSIDGNINVGEFGWTNFGIIGNNFISLGLGVWTLIKFVEKDVNSDEWYLFFEIFCCLEHQ